MDANAIATPKTPKLIKNESVMHLASALAVGATLKEFVVTGIIGEGGFGIVYSAQDTLLHRNVAIKEYMPAAIASRLTSSKINVRSARHQQTFAAGMQGFIDEARLLAQFKHPALVEILRFWEANDTAYMVMPHYSGKTLRTILKNSSNICSERWLKSILGPVLDAIELLHNNHIYHRDIAPDNIVIQDTGLPVLLDLGSARRVIAGMQSALTVVVKPGYAPIEQYTEDTASEQGPWTDIYALGAVLYFAISGSAPTASVSRMMRDSLKPLNTDDHPLYSDSFLSSINKALHLRPNDRFQSIEEFREALNISTLLTNPIALATLTLANSEQKNPQSKPQHQDEEITLILSEDEISVFKEKLLQSLHIPTATKPAEQAANENILANTAPAAKETSINTFADVQDLLNEKSYASNYQKSRKTEVITNSAQSNPIANNQTETPKSTLQLKQPALKSPIVIGIAVLTCVILAIVIISILVGKNDSELITKEQQEKNEQPIDKYKEGQEPINQLAQTTALANTENNLSYDVNNTDSVLSETPAINNAGLYHTQDESHLQPENSTERPNDNEANQASNEAKTNLSVDSTPQQITNTKNPVKTTNINVDEPNTTLHAAALGSAKLTLLPWGEVWIDNQRVGVSPPLREISLSPGTYTLELRSPGLPSEIRTLKFKQGDNEAIYHNFSAPQQSAPNSVNSAEQTTNMQKEKGETPKTQPSQQPEKVNYSSETVQPSVVSTPEASAPITTERTLNIKVTPWGEVYLDGKMTGVTPPLRQLKLTPGEHLIEIRHPSFTTKTIQISASDPVTAALEHHFQ